MYGVVMYTTLEGLLSRGKSISEIARALSMDRKTVRRIRDNLKEGLKVPKIRRRSKLDPYRDKIIEYLTDYGLTGVLIHRRLVEDHQIGVSYNCVKKYLRKLKSPGRVYTPLISSPGSEAQVDFGYLGYFYDNERKKKIKCWVFCMRLSYSRYDYYEIVMSQDIPTFIRCHINAFEYFNGAPSNIKIDNLKSGILLPNFYEPTAQLEYANMLKHYGSIPVACRVRVPEEKGKVESAIKYIKNNFLRNLETKELSEVRKELLDWQNNICNKRIHGTTRKMPLKEFIEKEKGELYPLPPERYEIWNIESRKVNSYGHITYLYNFYSVPCEHILQEVTVKSNGKILRILDKELNEIAVHKLSYSIGEFITQDFHNPTIKFQLEENGYGDKSLSYGKNIYEFYQKLKEKRPHHYHRMIQGIFNLCKKFGSSIVDAACKRANMYELHSYISVKKICEDGLFENNNPQPETVIAGGYYNNLKDYDTLTGDIICNK